MQINFDWLTPSLILTIYACLISTISLLWNIINSIIEKTPKLIVTAELWDTYTQYEQEKLISGPQMVKIEIVNSKNTHKYIDGIFIELPRTLTYLGQNSNLFCILKKDTQFPIKIEPQEQKNYKIPLYEQYGFIFENIQKGKCRFCVRDTTGKCYKSNKIKLSLLKEAFEYNVKLPEKTRMMFEK